MTLFIHRNAGGRCPCGAENATCGPPSSVVPVDQLIEEVPAVSGPLKKYKVTRGGVETVMKLSDDDAKRLGVGADAALDGASTIEPVQPVADQTDSDGEAADGTGNSGTPDGGDVAGAQPVQQAADSGGDGQTPDPQAKAADSPPAAKKTAAPKRRTASENKARTPSATKAADGGS